MATEIGLLKTLAGRYVISFMESMRYTYWEDAGMFIGHLEEFPDYMTQGISLEELSENLRDICDELTSGRIPAPIAS